jgi:hypothetical protein
VNTKDAQAAMMARRCVVRIHCVAVMEVDDNVMREALVKVE